jgi:anaerobic ribonucleoside-triphosphate reductase
MLESIKKRDGRIVPFNEDRITRAIYLAAEAVARRTGETADYRIAEGLTSQIVKLLNEKFSGNVPGVEDVQDTVVKVLIETGHARTSEAYITYRNERTRVRDSRTRLMKAIEEITFSDAADADVKRENANINGNTAMGTMLEYGSAVSREFCKTHVMNPAHAAAHDNGDIHIHDLDFMNMGTLTCCQIDIRKLFKGGFSTGHGFLREPQDIMSYAALSAIAIQSDQNDQHGGQSIPFFDYGLAPGITKTYRKLYVSNLAKSIEVLRGAEVSSNIKEIVKKAEIAAEKQTGRPIGLAADPDRDKAERQLLSETLHVSPAEIERLQSFAHKEACDETEARTYQAMEAFIHNLNTMHSRAGAQVPFSSINFGTDTSPEGRMVSRNLLLATEKGLGNGETPIFPILIFKVKEGVNFNPGDPNYDLFKLSCRVTSKRLFPNFSFLDAPFNAQYYKPGDPDTEATYMGCRTRVVANRCGPSTVSGRGNLSFTSINLPRLAILHGCVNGHKTDLDGFFRDLDSKIDLVIDQLLERMEIQGHKRVKNFPFLMGQGIWMGSEELGPEDELRDVIRQGTLTVGFIGLAECLKALIGKHHGESEEAQQLGLKIVRHMREHMDQASEQYDLNFSLIATPAEGLSGRFTRLDAARFGKIPGVTDREYYTNSFHVPVYYPISVFDKIAREAPYHALTNGGHISYVELDGLGANNPEAFEAIVRAMKETGIGYGSINHPVDRDPVCGYTGVIPGDVCPKCGRHEKDGPVGFERIRRITGYLVGTLDRFNNAKRAEVRDRVVHSMGRPGSGKGSAQ